MISIRPIRSDVEVVTIKDFGLSGKPLWVIWRKKTCSVSSSLELAP